MRIDNTDERAEQNADGAVDRRAFLKGAATGVAAAVGGKLSVVAAADAPKNEKKEMLLSDKTIARPDSDFMVDVIKTLGLEYVASNPGSSFRSLHESIVSLVGERRVRKWIGRELGPGALGALADGAVTRMADVFQV